MTFYKSSAISYFRNFIFGVEDSLVSTVGLLSGIATADIPKTTILITGVVLIFVEAISMAAGSFLSERSAENYAHKSEASVNSTFISGTIMFFSYFISGFIPLLPYIFFEVTWAFRISVGLSVLALFILGVIGAKISNINIVKNGLRMVIIGGVAIAVGVIAGNLLSGLQ